jgi:superoxide dismutase, Cu-Zn family
MMRAKLGAIVGVLVLAGCNGTTATPADVVWTTSIQGAAGWQHLSGDATVTWTPGASVFSTTMQIAGDEPGAVRPWHVHFNTCATGGGIVGADGDYPRLNIGTDGTATVSTTVPTGLSAAAPYHINVHLSEAQPEVIIACGDLTIQGSPPGQSPNGGGNGGPDY